MTLRHTSALVFAAISLSLALPAFVRAQACGCSCPSYSYWNDTMIVPANPRIFRDLSGYVVATARLTDVVNGDPIPILVEPAGDASGGAHWIQPQITLNPDHDYDLIVSAEPDAANDAPLSLRLFVDPEADLLAPSIPATVRTPDTEQGDYCYEVVGGELEGIADASELIQVTELELLRDDVSIGRLFVTSDRIFGTPEAGEGASDCFRSASIAGLNEGETLTARIRAWDFAGNSSEIVETTFTTGRLAALPAGTPCPYCAVRAPGRRSAPGVVGLIIALCVTIVRRRRAR